MIFVGYASSSNLFLSTAGFIKRMEENDCQIAIWKWFVLFQIVSKSMVMTKLMKLSRIGQILMYSIRVVIYGYSILCTQRNCKWFRIQTISYISYQYHIKQISTGYINLNFKSEDCELHVHVLGNLCFIFSIFKLCK